MVNQSTDIERGPFSERAWQLASEFFGTEPGKMDDEWGHMQCAMAIADILHTRIPAVAVLDHMDVDQVEDFAIAFGLRKARELRIATDWCREIDGLIV